jgi:hypothetical protein
MSPRMHEAATLQQQLTRALQLKLPLATPLLFVQHCCCAQIKFKHDGSLLLLL